MHHFAAQQKDVPILLQYMLVIENMKVYWAELKSRYLI